jgi:hypothetical protein
MHYAFDRCVEDILKFSFKTSPTVWVFRDGFGRGERTLAPGSLKAPAPSPISTGGGSIVWLTTPERLFSTDPGLIGA